MKLHLPKALLAAVITAIASVLPTTYGADIISINFKGDRGDISVSEAHANSTLGGTTANQWQNIACAAGTYNITNQAGQTAATLVLGGDHIGEWHSNVGSNGTLIGEVQKGYIDVRNHSGENHYTIAVDHDYWITDTIFYMAGDSNESGKSFAPMEVNGTAYIGGTNVKATEQNKKWSAGAASGCTEFTDANTIKVRTFGDLTATNVWNDADSRATLAGMQIIDRTDEFAYKTTLGAGETTAADAVWNRNGTTTAYGDIAAGEKILLINADAAGSTLKLENGDSIQALAVQSNTATIISDGTISLGNLHTYDAGHLILDCNATSEAFSITSTCSVEVNGKLAIQNVEGGDLIDISGSGTIELYNGANVAINGGTSDFTGNFVLKGGLFNLGATGDKNDMAQIDLSKATIDMEGGSIRYSGGNSTLGTVNINTDSTISIYATNKGGNNLGTLSINTLNVQEGATGTFSSTWEISTHIGVLTGEGSLVINNGSAGNHDCQIDSIASVEGLRSLTNKANLILGADADSTLNMAGTITNSKNLTINGTFSISDDLAGFTVAKEGTIGGLSENGTDGYQITTGSTYLLIDNQGGAVTLNTMTANYGGDTITLTQDETTKDVTFVGGESMDSTYRVNTADIIIGGDNATSNTARATSAIVAAGRTVTIAGGTTYKTSDQLLTSITGDGNINLTTDVSLVAGDVTQAKGTLTIAEGVTLNLGNQDLNGTSTQEASLSSFGSIVLDGATIKVNSKKDTWKDVYVTSKGASLHVEDLANSTEDKLIFAGTTTLNADFSMSNTWGAKIVFEKITGTGNLVIDDDARNEAVQLNINGAKDFSGKVHVKQSFANLVLNVAEDAGVNVHYEGMSGSELNLQSISSGNKVTLQGISAHLTKNSVINANVELLNYTAPNNQTLAAFEINDGFSGGTNTFNGSISGEGDFTVNKDLNGGKMTFTFAGDTSKWSGKMEVTAGEHDVQFTGTTTIKNSEIKTRNSDGGTTPTMNLSISHDSAAVTVNSLLVQEAGTMNLTTNAAQGVTFKKGVTVSSTTVAAGTTATFEVASTLGSLTLGNGASITATGDLTIGALTLDIQNYTTDFTQAHTLVSTTGTLNFTGDLTSYTSVQVGTYTATVTQSNNSLVLSFTSNATPEPNSFNVLGQAGYENGMLTLKVDADLANYDFTEDGAIVIPGISNDIMADIKKLTQGLEDSMVGITLMGADGKLVSADGNEQIGFLGNDGKSIYWGENVGTGSWQYNANYIPEPATATLSLLALAGLAARRRRRH